MNATFTRLYADADGESHFEDLTTDLKLVDFAPGEPPLFPPTPLRRRTSFLEHHPDGTVTGILSGSKSLCSDIG